MFKIPLEERLYQCRYRGRASSSARTLQCTQWKPQGASGSWNGQEAVPNRNPACYLLLPISVEGRADQGRTRQDGATTCCMADGQVHAHVGSNLLFVQQRLAEVDCLKRAAAPLAAAPLAAQRRYCDLADFKGSQNPVLHRDSLTSTFLFPSQYLRLL